MGLLIEWYLGCSGLELELGWAPGGAGNTLTVEHQSQAEVSATPMVDLHTFVKKVKTCIMTFDSQEEDERA